MGQRFILAIDQGTTGSTALVVDVSQPDAVQVVGRRTVDFPQHFPQTGWVEHDLEEVWSSVVQAIAAALAEAEAKVPGFRVQDIAGLGITNQRETLCVFERETARPLARAIVWQCKRSTAICARLKAEGHEAMLRAKTGLVLDPYFSGTKLTWIMENAPELAARLQSGKAVVGTIDSYLIARLSGGRAFVTEASNASRTLLFDLHSGTWDRGLLDLFKVPSISILPEIRSSAGEFGRTRGLSFLPDGVPITGVLGDQQAALAGQACFGVGEAKCTYGTGAFLLANLGDKPLVSRAGMLTTVAWSLGGRLTYAFEGSAFIAGAAVQFARDQLGWLARASDAEGIARDARGAPEVYFVPALAGLGAPHWDPKAQGGFFGLTRGTTKAQLIRAVLEGIAFQVADLTDAMAADLGKPLTVLRADGGAAANDLLLESQANFAGLPVDRPTNLETTATGAALCAAFGLGLVTDLATLAKMRRQDRLFTPHPDESLVASQRAGWRRAVRAVQVFAGSAT